MKTHASILMLLIAVLNCLGQPDAKENLRLLESRDAAFLSAIRADAIKKIKTGRETEEVQLGQCLDSLIAYVSVEKAKQDATFDSVVKPYLEQKLIKWNMHPLDFSEEEEAVLDSFVENSDWPHVTEITTLYEDFVTYKCKDRGKWKSLLTFFSSVKAIHAYLSNNPDQSLVKTKLTEALTDYNAVDWSIYAMDPGAMMVWMAATFAWEGTDEKCTEKL